MAAPADNDRDDALLRRLYDEPDAEGADGELAREVESFQRVRKQIADYARATEVEPPARGLDELLAAARQRAPARAAAAAPEPAGFWARLRAWFAPIAAHPALASAAMVVLVGGVAGVLYVKGKAPISESRVGGEVAAPAQPMTGSAPAREVAPRDRGVVVGLDDGGQGSATADNQVIAPAATPAEAEKTKKQLADRSRPDKKPPVQQGQGGGHIEQADSEAGGERAGEDRNVAVGAGTVVANGADRSTKAPVTDPALPTAPPPPPVSPTAGLAVTDDFGGEDVLIAEGEHATAPQTSPDAGTKSSGVDKRQQPSEQDKMEQLTRQARTAAKSGDCGVVKSIGGRVKKANATYYKRTFSADTTIKKCL